ncbi:MAG: hypothetical protein GKC10_01555 [Methanosarcinales archaeon]|nr:hypothetical protein [Methanosarcinales archaeon]
MIEEQEKPWIVVSDIHLGGSECNFIDFREFVSWVDALGTARIEGCEYEIHKPGTVVLLGDALELWDPRDDDRTNTINETLIALSELSGKNYKIVYVAGNHDEDVGEISRLCQKNGANICSGNLDLKVVERQYPETAEVAYEGTFKNIPIVNRMLDRKHLQLDGVTIGPHKYVFMHGHQFDKGQFFHRASRVLGIRFDPIDYFQDLANVSLTKEVGLRFNKTSMIFMGLLAAFVLVLSQFKNATIYSIGGFSLLVASSFFTLTVIPKVVASSNTVIWPKIKNRLHLAAKGLTPQQIAEERYNKEKGKFLNTDVIVFGHTHIPDAYYSKDIQKLFINTGCWVCDKDCPEDQRNTFLYIDDVGPHLLKWDKGGVKCLKHAKDSQCRLYT